MTVHHMKLRRTPFFMIVNGEKTIESRLYDDKRRKVELGDVISFVLTEDSSQEVRVRVLGLLRYKTFKDMYMHNDAVKFGGKSKQELSESIFKYYTREEQQRYGVLGIEFQRDE